MVINLFRGNYARDLISINHKKCKDTFYFDLVNDVIERLKLFNFAL
jgi:hypothetical protein